MKNAALSATAAARRFIAASTAAARRFSAASAVRAAKAAQRFSVASVTMKLLLVVCALVLAADGLVGETPGSVLWAPFSTAIAVAVIIYMVQPSKATLAATTSLFVSFAAVRSALYFVDGVWHVPAIWGGFALVTTAYAHERISQGRE